MSQQLICDECGLVIDTSQPYYTGNLTQVVDVGGGAPTAATPTRQLDYHVEHSPIPPQLDSLAPASIRSNEGDVRVTVHGSGFTNDSKIVFGGAVLGTGFVSASELYCTINSGHGIGTTPLLVRRGDLDSNALTFTITA